SVSPVHVALHPAGPLPAPHSFPTRRSSDLGVMSAAATLYPNDGGETASQTRRGDSHRPYSPSTTGKDGASLPASVPIEISIGTRSEEHTSELQSRSDLVCRLLLEKQKKQRA